MSFIAVRYFHNEASQIEILEHSPPFYLLVSDVRSHFKARLCGFILVSAQYLYCVVRCFITRKAKISEAPPAPCYSINYLQLRD